MRAVEPEIRIAKDAEELARAAAGEFARCAREAVSQRGKFVVALAGGSTPKAAYSVLAEHPAFRSLVPWEKLHFFWGDERHVRPDHPDSNFRMANEALLSRVPVPATNIHRVRAENQDAAAAASEYEKELREFFKTAAKKVPCFDLVLLGLGPDGHTASLFPGSDALLVQDRYVFANWVEKFGAYRITLTLPVINNASAVLFVVSGEAKAEAAGEVLNQGRASPRSASRLPAELVRPASGRLLWLLDRAAAQNVEVRA